MNTITANNEKGMVMILVLLILVAAIITGIAVSRSSIIDARIAGNEREYVETLNKLDSATSYALIASTTALSMVANSQGASYSYPAADLPGSCNKTVLKVELRAIRKPPVGKGYDPSMRARHYTIDANDTAGAQELRVGAYKVFPPSVD